MDKSNLHFFCLSSTVFFFDMKFYIGRMIIVQKKLVLISGTLKIIISIDVDDDEYKAMTRATRTVCLEQNLQYNLELEIDVDDLYLIS